MLILRRKEGERVRIKTREGEHIWIRVENIKGKSVAVAIDVPTGMQVLREELITLENDMKGDQP